MTWNDVADDERRGQRGGGIAVTLVSGGNSRDVAEAAATIAGVVPGEYPPAGRESPDVEALVDALGEELCAQAGGMSGLRVVALDPAVDVLAAALMLEHRFESRGRREAPVGVHDVVTVTSVDEVLASLFDVASDEDPADWYAGERLVTRLEFASRIVVTDAERASLADKRRVMSLLIRLNPTARIVSRERLRADLPDRIRLVRRRAHGLAATMGWQCELAGRSVPVEGPVTSYVFRDPRPFHPARLHRMVGGRLADGSVGRIVRSRGLVRLATRADTVGSWSSAGDVLNLDPTSMLSWDPDSPIGQELVFFGEDLDRDELASVLQHCLLTESELLEGSGSWSAYHDPFPAWP